MPAKTISAACLAALATAVALAGLALGGTPVPAAAEAGPAGGGAGGLTTDPVAGFDSPVHVAGPRGANGLIFVVEQAGVIRLIKDGKKLGGSFLDISDKVQAGGERGLLSVAFAPGYSKNRRFYVFFTDEQGDLKIQEYRRSRRNPRDAKEGSARTVIEIGHRQNSNHNGGQLQFGPDDLLYIGTGDGGSSGDPPENAQNKGSLLGKILRIDPRRDGKRAYRVPPSNPFTGRPGADEVFAYGLRNPYRFSFDPARDVIAIGDVGQDAREEIDVETLDAARGANFGWDAFEGFGPYEGSDASPPPDNHTPPIHDYGHGGGNCAITGGVIVRDRRIPSLAGRYLYADFCGGEIRSLRPKGNTAADDRPAGLASERGLSSFGTDSRGRVWFTNLVSGEVSRLKPR